MAITKTRDLLFIRTLGSGVKAAEVALHALCPDPGLDLGEHSKTPVEHATRQEPRYTRLLSQALSEQFVEIGIAFPVAPAPALQSELSVQRQSGQASRFTWS